MLLRPEFERELQSRGWTPDRTFVWLHQDYPFLPICSRPVGDRLGLAFVSFKDMPYGEVIQRLDEGTLV